jgi:prophage regulatory protein
MRFLSYPDLRGKGIKYSRVHIARLEKQKLFPMHVPVGLNRVAWIEEEIDEFSRRALRRATTRMHLRPAPAARRPRSLA